MNAIHVLGTWFRVCTQYSVLTWYRLGIPSLQCRMPDQPGILWYWRLFFEELSLKTVFFADLPCRLLYQSLSIPIIPNVCHTDPLLYQSLTLPFFIPTLYHTVCHIATRKPFMQTGIASQNCHRFLSFALAFHSIPFYLLPFPCILVYSLPFASIRFHSLVLAANQSTKAVT